jgi:hypothetical protein
MRRGLRRSIHFSSSLIVPPLQSGHHAVSFGNAAGVGAIRANFILPPQDGQRRTVFPPVGAPVRRLTFSTTIGVVRAWLKLWRTTIGSVLRFPISSASGWREGGINPVARNYQIRTL